MGVQVFNSYEEAAVTLEAIGLKPNYCLFDREYWWFDNGADRLNDHSATITVCGSKFLVSNFVK